jgi:Ala-tRNA(Pro) deacylase
MDIHSIEKQLHQGKLSFASEQRMMKYLGVTPGSVTPFGLINDLEHHVHVFLDKNLQQAKRLSFHPCINTASLIVAQNDFIRFLDFSQNRYEWLDVY